MNKVYKYWGILIGILILSSCSITKYVPEGDALYLGGIVKVDDKELAKNNKKNLEEELASLLRPKPNTSFLSIRFGLMMYKKNAKGIGGFLSKKFGQPPVLFSTVKVDYNRKLLSNRLENRGYFNPFVTADTTIKNKKASLTYHAKAGTQYVINSVKYDADSSTLGKAIAATASSSFLKVGDPYSLDVIKSERERIDGRLKEKGFYYFSPDNLLILVDSTNNRNKVDLVLNVKASTPTKAGSIYSINNIIIYPNFRARDTTKRVFDKAEKYKDFYIIDPRHTFKPAVFDRAMFFGKGDVYNRTDHNLSLNRLVDLGTFKFVKNRFEDADTAGKSMLDVFYYLTPYPKKSLRAEITGRQNSANFTGTEVSVSWRNRNAFKGAELLTVSAHVGTDVQVSSGSQLNNSIYRIGGEVNLNIPRFITPFKVNTTSAFVPRTKISLGYDLLIRQNSYTLNTFQTSLGYVWKQDAKIEHKLNVIAVNYVQPYKITPEYMALAANDVTLRKAIEKQFTIGPNYNYNFTNSNETYKRNTFYENFNLDLSGNLLGAIKGANYKTGDTATLFGARFAQYVRFENDFRHYLKVGRNSQLASRIITGYGYSYGNSFAMPYVKQFFIGGTNSLRGFRARTVGPGLYRDPKIEAGQLTTDQSGDIKLEMNTEYRPTLYKIIKGALFVDAGNIWLLRNDPTPTSDPAAAELRKGRTFSKDFLNELAVDAGVGLRFDLSFLVLRTDLAFPIRKPWLEPGQRFVFNNIDFTSKKWRGDNLIFNLAIGYPF